MICRWRTRVDTGDHHDFRLMWIKERVSKNHSKLRCPERHVGAAWVKSSDALLKSQQTRVNWGSLHTSLSVVTLAVSCTFWTRQIDKQKFTQALATAILHFNLTHSMRARRGVIGFCGARGSWTMSIVNDLVHLIFVPRLSFSETHNLDFVLAIFLDGQLFLIVE